MVTWTDLVAAEPELERLLVDIKRQHAGPRYCANAVWYGFNQDPRGGFKGRLVRLVGWEAQGSDARLWSCEAYETAYQVCYRALPDCCHEGHGC